MLCLSTKPVTSMKLIHLLSECKTYSCAVLGFVLHAGCWDCEKNIVALWDIITFLLRVESSFLHLKQPD